MPRFIELNNSNLPSTRPVRVSYCDSFVSRLRGLMFQNTLELDSGILLVQSRDSRIDSSIHMLAVFMDLGVIWINAELNIVDKVLAKSWRLAYFPKKPAKYILEIHPDRMDDFRIRDKVTFHEI